MIFSLLAWFWILYFSVGFLITFEAMVTAWDKLPEFLPLAKIIGSAIVLICWPLMFFIEN